MNRSPFFSRVSLVLVIVLLAVTGSAAATGASSGSGPVVNGITGPTGIDNPFSATGTYTFAVVASGGTPPYSYKWFIPPATILFEGKDYATVRIPGTKLRVAEPGKYWVWVSVTDANGQQATWMRSNGLGATPEFAYGFLYDGVSWTVKTEPATFPAKVSSGPVNQPAAVSTVTRVDSGARFSSVSGQVKIWHEGAAEDDWKTAKVDTPLYEGDKIETDEDATCILSFADMSSYVMKSETTIILAKTTGPESKLKLVAGNIWANIKKMAKDGDMEVDMSQGVAGIKGTTFVLEENPGSSVLKVIEGNVQFTAKADGKTVAVGSGQSVRATGSGLGTVTQFNATAEQASWDAVTAKMPPPFSASATKAGMDGLTAAGLIALAFGIVGVAGKRS
jgi:hypothetical protein